MTNFPSISGKQLLVALQKSGFELVRIKGGHHFIRHADGRSTVVPVHSNESIGPGLLAKILRDCDTSRDQLHQLL
jgi:predicted RNA binding protein YcfA (HicA-like mRNA interferase family)